MRRAVTTATMTVAVLVLSALPLLAAEDGATERAEPISGSMVGVAYAAAFGVAFGIIVVLYSYRLARYGESDAHHEHTHDVRDGIGGHDPGIEDPVGGAQDRTGAA